MTSKIKHTPLEIEFLCDACGDKNDKGLTINLPGSKDFLPVEVDLCHKCAKTLSILLAQESQ